MKFHPAGLLAAACLLLLGRPPVWAAEGAPFEVNSTLDFSATNAALSASGSNGDVSLRSAIEAATAQSGAHTITFGISGSNPQIVISGNALPEITSKVVIDATINRNLLNAGRVFLMGGQGPVLPYGLFITNGECTVRGLDIENFDQGIMLTNGKFNVIQSNRLANNGNGIYIGADATSDPKTASNANMIGGTNAGLANIIVSNSTGGIYLYDSLFNTIQGNLIGIDINGSAAGNHLGVILNDSDYNTVGGSETGAGNIISGNTLSGILIAGGAGNAIVHNRIGTTVDGTAAMGNGDVGVAICSGYTPSGGIRNASDNSVGGNLLIGTGNVISGNGYGGVLVTSAAAAIGSNKIQGNYIGTNAAGNAPLFNNGPGIEIAGSSINVIGGTKPGQGNVLSGNEYGILIDDAAIPFNALITGTIGSVPAVLTVFNFVRGNLIGTGTDSTLGIPNGEGILIKGSSGNVIGGTMEGAGNLIADNDDRGIVIGTTSGGFGPAVGNLVQGNLIAGNEGSGVYLGSAASDCQIGGMAKGAGNTIIDNTLPLTGGTCYGVNFATSGSNAVLRNSIFGNGVPPFVGAFFGINSPSKAQLTLRTPTRNGGETMVPWTLTDPAKPAGAKTKYLLQFFSNPAADTAQGNKYLGKGFATLDAGNTSTAGTSKLKDSPDFITATATQLDNKGRPLLTSTFSNVVESQ